MLVVSEAFLSSPIILANNLSHLLNCLRDKRRNSYSGFPMPPTRTGQWCDGQHFKQRPRRTKWTKIEGLKD